MSKKALVVDNDFFFVEFMTELLEERGYAVVKAYDGKEAMIRLESDRFDILFADIVMPKVDGWQLIRHVKTAYPDRAFPVVAVSGTIVEQIDDLDKIGADYFIAKGPIEKMKVQILEFLGKVGQQAFPSAAEQTLYRPGTIYPRRESIELIESLQYQQAVFECVGIGIVLVDGDGRVINANPSALELLCSNRTKAISQPVGRLFPPEEARELIGMMKRIAKRPELGKLRFTIGTCRTSLRIVLSLLRVDEKASGWILAMEEADKWGEPA